MVEGLTKFGGFPPLLTYLLENIWLVATRLQNTSVSQGLITHLGYKPDNFRGLGGKSENLI